MHKSVGPKPSLSAIGGEKSAHRNANVSLDLLEIRRRREVEDDRLEQSGVGRFHELRSCDADVVYANNPRIDLCSKVFGKPRNSARRSALIKLAADLRHAICDGNDGAD